MNDDLKSRVSLYLKGENADKRLVVDLCAYIEFLENRNEHMARALKPFADAADAYEALEIWAHEEHGIVSAEDDEIEFSIEELRQARHSYQLSHHNPEYAELLSQPSKSGVSA